MTQEEILLRVGLDGSGFDSNLTKSETALTRFGEHAHHSFLHATAPARAFHHVLGEIGSRVPLLSEALQGLINPTTGVIALVGAGFALAMDKLKEFNKNMDEISASNAKSIESNREGLAALTREQKEFQKTLSIDPVTGITKAVGEEKDPTTRLSQARINRDRFASERNARLEEIKRLREEERRLTSLPARIKATEELIDSIKKSPADIRTTTEFLPDLPFATGIGATRPHSEDFNIERLQILQNQLGSMRAQFGTPERLKGISERRQQLENEARERSRAVNELQGIIDPLDPRDFMSRGRRGGSFSITGAAGSFSGTVGGNAQDIKNYLKQIAESPWVKDGKVSVPNGK